MCGKAFTRSDSLRRHVTKAHFEPAPRLRNEGEFEDDPAICTLKGDDIITRTVRDNWVSIRSHRTEDQRADEEVLTSAR